MHETATCIRGCCGFLTVISRYGEGFVLPAEIAKKAGLSEGKSYCMFFWTAAARILSSMG
jgi:hypothetical protein